jgi:hypothetical protein
MHAAASALDTVPNGCRHRRGRRSRRAGRRPSTSSRDGCSIRGQLRAAAVGGFLIGGATAPTVREHTDAGHIQTPSSQPASHGAGDGCGLRSDSAWRPACSRVPDYGNGGRRGAMRRGGRSWPRGRPPGPPSPFALFSPAARQPPPRRPRIVDAQERVLVRQRSQQRRPRRPSTCVARHGGCLQQLPRSAQTASSHECGQSPGGAPAGSPRSISCPLPRRRALARARQIRNP